jgi:hypothetical protein
VPKEILRQVVRNAAAEARQTSNVRMGCGGLGSGKGREGDVDGGIDRQCTAGRCRPAAVGDAAVQCPVSSVQCPAAGQAQREAGAIRDGDAWRAVMMAKLLVGFCGHVS